MVEARSDKRDEAERELHKETRWEHAASALTFSASLAAVMSTLGTTGYKVVADLVSVDASAYRSHEAQILAVVLGAVGLAAGWLFKARQAHTDDTAGNR